MNIRVFSFAILILTSAQAVFAQSLVPLTTEDHADWVSIGRVNSAGFRSRDMCSGTLIAPDKVLTAAHCVAKGDGTVSPPDQITFVAGWLRGEYVAASPAQSIWVHPDAISADGLDIRHDIAVLTLANPIDVSPLPLSSVWNSQESDWAIVGYTSKRPHILSAAFTCEAEFAQTLMRLSCPVHPGNSGGPVLTQSDGQWRVAAVVSARSKQGTLAVSVSQLPSF